MFTHRSVLKCDYHSVSVEQAALLLDWDTVIFLMSHRRSQPETEGQTVITTCGDSHVVPLVTS